MANEAESYESSDAREMRDELAGRLAAMGLVISPENVEAAGRMWCLACNDDGHLDAMRVNTLLRTITSCAAPPNAYPGFMRCLREIALD